MEIVRTVRPQNGMAELRLWRCEGSNIVHMKVGPLVVNFDPGEFNRFAESVIDVNYTESPRLRYHHFEPEPFLN